MTTHIAARKSTAVEHIEETFTFVITTSTEQDLAQDNVHRYRCEISYEQGSPKLQVRRACRRKYTHACTPHSVKKTLLPQRSAQGSSINEKASFIK